MAQDGLKQFAGQNYLNLESFRRNGQGVKTPLWFVEMDGKLYVRTPESFAKVKRVRNNPRVRVVPCSMGGTPKGAWVEGAARIVQGDEAERANQLLKRKYGWQRALIDIGSRLRKRKSVVIVIEVPERELHS